MNRRDVLKTTAGGFAFSPLLVGGRSPLAVGRSVSGAVPSLSAGRTDVRTETVYGTVADVRSYALPDRYGVPADPGVVATVVGLLSPGGVSVDEYDWTGVPYETTELDDGSFAVHSIALPVGLPLGGTRVEWCSPRSIPDECEQGWCQLQRTVDRFFGDVDELAVVLGFGSDEQVSDAQRAWDRRNEAWAANPEDAPIRLGPSEGRPEAAVAIRREFNSWATGLLSRAADAWIVLGGRYFSPYYAVDPTYRDAGGTPGLRVSYAPDFSLFPLEPCDQPCETDPWSCLSEAETWELTMSHRLDDVWSGYKLGLFGQPVRVSYAITQRLDARVVLERFGEVQQGQSVYFGREGEATASVTIVLTDAEGTFPRTDKGTRTIVPYDPETYPFQYAPVSLGPLPFRPRGYLITIPVVEVDGLPAGLFPPDEEGAVIGGELVGEPRDDLIADLVPTDGYDLSGSYEGEVPAEYFGLDPFAGFTETPDGPAVTPMFRGSWEWTMRPLSFADGCESPSC